MIYITGDMHGQFERIQMHILNMKGYQLNEDDYLIVCGDFAICWETCDIDENNSRWQMRCSIFDSLPFTILWVQGNHENYDMLEKFLPEEWHGGKVRHIIRDKVILLERGQVFEIEGKKFFTFGGAKSHDVQGGIFERSDKHFHQKVALAQKWGLPYRIMRETWWPEELPSKKEMFEGLKNLEKEEYAIDYVITHCCATSLQNEIVKEYDDVYEPDILTDYFEQIEKKLKYKHWYFGHYHRNQHIDEKHTVLYQPIIKLDETGDFSKVPKLGRPKYKKGDIVSYKFINEIKTGVITVVDAYGTFSQREEPSYDIMIQEPKLLHKHIMESLIMDDEIKKG